MQVNIYIQTNGSVFIILWLNKLKVKVMRTTVHIKSTFPVFPFNLLQKRYIESMLYRSGQGVEGFRLILFDYFRHSPLAKPFILSTEMDIVNR